jgi:hypothetical protein
MTGVACSSDVDWRLFGASQAHAVSDRYSPPHRPTRAATMNHDQLALEGQTTKTHRRDTVLRGMLRSTDHSRKTIAWTLSSIR